MTPHVRARLSAYLDGELPVAERSAVDQHLRACAACARRLEDLAALDAAARALPLEAPPDYFERLPARIRGRLERKPQQTWRPPAWTWAVAAGLLLAIVTPATLLRRATAPPAAGGRPLETQERLPDTVPPPPSLRQDEPAAPKRVEDLAAGSPSVAPRQERDSAAPAAPPAKLARPTPAPAGGDTRLREQEPSTAEREDADAPMAGFAQPAPTPGGAETTPAKDEAGRLAAEKPLAPPRSGAPGARRRDAVMVPAPARAAQWAAAAEACSAGMLAKGAPGSLAQARALREGWRACLRDFPAATGADAVRVRMIEAGVDVYRRGGDAADLEQVRVDAAEYLARADAGESERVRALLRELDEQP
jgi:hypothetical protein